MDGLQATKILKEDKHIKHINIVALTSHAMEGDSKKAMEAGCNGYLTKPIDTREFIKQISIYLPDKKTTVERSVSSHKSEKMDEENNRYDPKILIVDDDPMNLKLLRGKLSGDYRHIYEANDGKTALDLSQKIIPDLVLSDIMMPGMDGFELTRELKALSKTSKIPVILVTALDGHNYKVMGYEAGADDFLNKPVNTVELRSRVKSLLSLKQYQDKLASNFDSDEKPLNESCLIVDPTFLHSKILILMDEAEYCQTVEMYLHGQPYRIVSLKSHERKIESICALAPDIIILNEQGNKGCLVELCQRIKTNTKTKCSQLLYLTDETDLKENFPRIEDHVDDFLTLPYNIYELRARIKVLLKKKALMAQLLRPTPVRIENVVTDPISGLYTFDYCKHVLKHELQRSIRGHSNVAFVNLAINQEPMLQYVPKDAFSMDDLSNELSLLIGKSIRKLDIACRRSPWHFAFVLPESDKGKAKGFINRIKDIICNHLNALDPSIHITEKHLMFAYTICPEQSDQIESIVQITDVALENATSKTALETATM
jgi:two-component system cell cycle response regulator